MSLKSGCNSTFNYADYMAEFGLNSKMSHLIQQKITILHEKYINFDQKCFKNSENADYDALCYKNGPKIPVTRITRSFEPDIM